MATEMNKTYNPSEIEDRLYKKNKNSPASLGCGMNYKIRVTSVVGGETVSPTDMKLIPAGRNTGIQPLHKGYRLWIKTNKKRKCILPPRLKTFSSRNKDCCRKQKQKPQKSGKERLENRCNPYLILAKI